MVEKIYGFFFVYEDSSGTKLDCVSAVLIST